MDLWNRIKYELGNFRTVVSWLIVINLVVFLAEILTGYSIAGFLGLVPARVTTSFWVWQPVTYMFLHGGFFHIFINLYVLWMFGRIFENRWGSREFLKFYFICGLGAALLTILTGPFSNTVSVGASGAIYGILVAFALEYPEERIYLYFVLPIKAKYFVIMLGALAFIGSAVSGTGIAHFAHLGGLLTGFIYLRWYRGRG